MNDQSTELIPNGQRSGRRAAQVGSPPPVPAVPFPRLEPRTLSDLFSPSSSVSALGSCCRQALVVGRVSTAPSRRRGPWSEPGLSCPTPEDKAGWASLRSRCMLGTAVSQRVPTGRRRANDRRRHAGRGGARAREDWLAFVPSHEGRSLTVPLSSCLLSCPFVLFLSFLHSMTITAQSRRQRKEGRCRPL